MTPHRARTDVHEAGKGRHMGAGASAPGDRSASIPLNGSWQLPAAPGTGPVAEESMRRGGGSPVAGGDGQSPRGVRGPVNMFGSAAANGGAGSGNKASTAFGDILLVYAYCRNCSMLQWRGTGSSVKLCYRVCQGMCSQHSRHLRCSTCPPLRGWSLQHLRRAASQPKGLLSSTYFNVPCTTQLHQPQACSAFHH